MTDTPTTTVDCRGMACPGPITEVARAYRKAQNGDILEILATDPGFTPDIKGWVSATSNQLITIAEEEGVIRALVKITAKR
ncbi:MAG: sulfurtransferase TusA family protein [Candidatus Thorarchaeota archaeon]